MNKYGWMDVTNKIRHANALRIIGDDHIADRNWEWLTKMPSYANASCDQND